MEEERYNHWEVLSNLDVIKDYVNEYYKSKWGTLMTEVRWLEV